MGATGRCHIAFSAMRASICDGRTSDTLRLLHIFKVKTTENNGLRRGAAGRSPLQ